MRPGQELIWTQLTINNNGHNKNNMIVGVLDSEFDGLVRVLDSLRLTVKEQTKMKFTLGNIVNVTKLLGASMRMHMSMEQTNLYVTK